MAVADAQQYAALIAEGYNFIPVLRRLVADGLTPVAAFARLEQEPDAFLFESVVGGERQARYSMLGCAPDERLVGSWQGLRVVQANGHERPLSGDVFSALRGYLSDFRSPQLPGLPRFSGGLVGYWGYDVVRAAERLPPPGPDPLGLPDVHLCRYDTVAVFDHTFNQVLLIAHADLRGGQALPSALALAQAKLDALQAKLEAPLNLPFVEPPAPTLPAFTHHTSQADFEATVARIQEWIKAGDIFQAVPSLRLSMPLTASPLQVYRSLRSLNPSPYLFCLRQGPNALVGASPEILVRVENGTVTVRPIAGTAARGADQAEDERLAQELLADPKERAEHVMLIDLGRNDVGRVAVPGSVRLDEEMVIEKYSHVQHIVSHVSGTLRPDLDALDALRCCHPAGTVSGAPKIRAMEIINSCEPIQRGPYAGAVGYLDFRGNLDTCIALRTAILTPGEAHVQAGAGVVADSIPHNEYQECLRKARAMLTAIARADAF